MQDEKQSSGNGPVRRAAIDSPRFVSRWLTGGQSLTSLQRIGYGFFSISFIMAGIFCANGAKLNFQDSSVFMGLGFSLATLFFWLFGSIGLRNVLRFRTRD
jgi:hypothetical protein